MGNLIRNSYRLVRRVQAAARVGTPRWIGGPRRSLPAPAPAGG